MSNDPLSGQRWRATVRAHPVLVLGMGRSGQAAARLLLKDGGRPILFDDVTSNLARPEVEEIVREGAEVAATDPLQSVGLVITSPGVHRAHPLLSEARARGIPVWGELEFAFRHCAAPVLAVTGSDGKSTTCALLAHLLGRDGRPVELGGNIGTPFSAIAPRVGPEGLAVVEVSSYQLEGITSFRPWVASILNIAPDHLERHGSMEAYASAKARIFHYQESSDFSVVNADRHLLQDLVAGSRATRLLFSGTGPVHTGACMVGNWLSQAEGGSIRRILPADRLRITGHHNVENALAALAMLLPLNIAADRLADGLASYKALPHRIEPVGFAAGVRYLNDSKATNVHAAAACLASMALPVVLVAGGKDKGLAFKPLAEAARGKVRAAVLFGEAGPRMAEALSSVAPVHCVADLAEAVHRAAAVALPGDVVLLSPACSSFDAYGSFEERGDHFKSLVHALPGFSADRAAAQESPKNSSR